MLRVKSHFWTGLRIVREGTLLEEVEPRFNRYVEEVTPEKAVNDYGDAPMEDPAPPTRKILVHRPVKGGKSGPALKKAK